MAGRAQNPPHESDNEDDKLTSELEEGEEGELQREDDQDAGTKDLGQSSDESRQVVPRPPRMELPELEELFRDRYTRECPSYRKIESGFDPVVIIYPWLRVPKRHYEETYHCYARGAKARAKREAAGEYSSREDPRNRNSARRGDRNHPVYTHIPRPAHLLQVERRSPRNKDRQQNEENGRGRYGYSTRSRGNPNRARRSFAICSRGWESGRGRECNPGSDSVAFEPDSGSGRPDGGNGRPDGGSGRPDGGSGRPDGGSGGFDGGNGN